MGKTVQDYLDQYRDMPAADAVNWAAGGNVYEKPPPVIPQNPTSGDKAIDEAASFATGSQWGINNNKEPVAPDIASLQAGPAVPNQNQPPAPALNATGQTLPNPSRPETNDIQPPLSSSTPESVTTNREGGFGMEKLDPEITKFATQAPVKNQFDDPINRQIAILQAGEYSTLAGKNVVSPHAMATIAELMKVQRGGDAQLQHAEVAGRFGMAGHVINWGERNELRRLALEQKASENATREKDVNLRQQEIEWKNREAADTKNHALDEKTHSTWGKNPQTGEIDFGKGLFEAAHNGVAFRTDTYQKPAEEIYAPFKSLMDTAEKKQGKPLTTQQKKVMHDSYVSRVFGSPTNK